MAAAAAAAAPSGDGYAAAALQVTVSALARGLTSVAAQLDAIAAAPPVAGPTRLVLSVAGAPALSPHGTAGRSPLRTPALPPVEPPAEPPASAPVPLSSPDRSRFELVGPQRSFVYTPRFAHDAAQATYDPLATLARSGAGAAALPPADADDMHATSAYLARDAAGAGPRDSFLGEQRALTPAARALTSPGASRVIVRAQW